MHKVFTPSTKDIEFLKRLVIEYYELNFPTLVYKSVDLEASDEDPLYHETLGWKFKEFRIPLHFIYNQEEMELVPFMLDIKHQVLFTAAVPIFERIGISPKAGDVIIVNGENYKVAAIHTKEDSQFGYSGYFGEQELVANRPSPSL